MSRSSLNNWSGIKVKDCYQEIIKLHKMLDNFGVKHIFEQAYDGYRVSNKNGSAVENSYSYGHSDDLLELRGFDIDSKKWKSYISANEAADYFIFAENKNARE